MAYPHGRFRYKVEIDGLEAGGFSEVTGFDTTFDVLEYRAGDSVQTVMKAPGLRKYGNITLKQGLADSMVLYSWLAAGIDKKVERKTITITLLDEDNAPAASWQVINAWPMKYNAPDFNSTATDVAVESIEIAHEGMTRVS